MRYVIVLVAILLLFAGIAVLFLFPVAAALAGFVSLLAFRRIVFGTLWALIVILFIPDRWRHVLENDLRAVKERTIRRVRWVYLAWKYGPLERRAFMSVCGACACGGLAGILIFSPGSIARVPFIGRWLSDDAMPYLMRTAAFKTVEANIPEAWKHVPEEVRPFIRRPFVRLWWKTARHGVKTRQMLGKHSPYRLRHNNTVP